MLKKSRKTSPAKLMITAAAAVALLGFGFNTNSGFGPSPAVALDTEQPSKPKKPASSNKGKKKKSESKKKKNSMGRDSNLWIIEEKTGTAYLTQARTSIASGDYRQAIVELAALNRPDDANVLNLLGYSHRKLGLVDVGISYYLRALENNPQHSGVHEYLGEAYVQKNEVDKARVLLKNLASICGTDCLEYKELASTIAKYEARQNL